jgi:Domain of unknown function (DUF4168)
MEQAYLYRMAATVKMDRIPLLEEGGGSKKKSEAPAEEATRNKEKLVKFVASMNEIEMMRHTQIERLKKALQVEEFPPRNINISDPTIQPFLNNRVRAVVEAFPLQAADIVKKHSLETDEFNHLLQETKTNPLFRWKVQKQLRTLPSSAASGSLSSPGSLPPPDKK